MTRATITDLQYKFTEEQLYINVCPGYIAIEQGDKEMRSLCGGFSSGTFIRLSPSQARFFGFEEEAQLAEEMAGAKPKPKKAKREGLGDVMVRILDCLGK